MIVAQAEFQAEVAVGPSHRLAFLHDVSSHLVKGHLQQALQTLSLRRAVFQNVGLHLTLSRRIDSLVENSDFLISICGYAERAAAISKCLILDIVVTFYR